MEPTIPLVQPSTCTSRARIDDERKRRGVISIWNRDEKTLDFNNGKRRDDDPNTNIIIREPGHVEYAGKLGLGVHELEKIRVEEIVI